MSFILFLSASVGVIDGGMAMAPRIDNVEVNIIGESVSAPQAKGDTKRSHAANVIKMITQGYKPTKADKLTIYYGSPFSEAKGDNDHEMNVDWNKMNELLVQFKANGVKYVCTTFVTTDSKRSLAFLKKAKELDLIVVTSLGNNELKNPYPAMHEGTISVLDTNIVNGKFDEKATYKTDGSIMRGTKVVTFGSSFATAKITGKLAKN